MFDRVKNSRLVQVLILYLGASWVILEVAGELQEALALPAWVQPVAIILLLIGLVVVMATAWVQSHPTVDAREDAGEVPESWEVGLGDLFGAIRRGELPHLTWGRAVVGGIVALSLLFGFAGLLVLTKARGPAFDPVATVAGDQAGAGLVVAPFTVSGVDEAVYGAGMVSLLAATLDGVPGIRAIDPRTVMARWTEVEEERGDLDLEGTLDVARRAGARYALVGSAVDAGAEISLVGDLYGVEDARKLGTARGEGAPDSLMALVDRFSVEVARLLVSEGAGGLDLLHLESLTTSSLDALLAYIDGEEQFRRGAWNPALDAYQRAVQRDSTFALAHLRAYTVLGWRDDVSTEEGGEHLAAARRHAARLPARERVLLEAFEAVGTGDTMAIASAEEAVRRYPDDPDLWYALGELRFHAGIKFPASSDRGRDAFEQAIALAPGFIPYLIHLTELVVGSRDSAAAADLLRRAESLASDSTFPYIRGPSAAFAFLHGDSAEQVAAVTSLDAEAAMRASDALFGIDNLPALEAFHRTRHSVAGGGDSYSVAYANTLAHRGRVRESISLRLATGWVAARNRTILHHQGLIPEAELPEGDWGPRMQGFGAAYTAMVRGDTVAGDAARGRYAAFLGETAEEDWLLRLVDAIRALKVRGADDAEDAVMSMYEAFSPGDPFVTPYVLWIVGDMYEQREEPRVAYGYFLAGSRWSPLAALRAARLADQLGETEEARRLYRGLLTAWEGADPQFEPWLEEARGWLERVPG